MEKRKLDICTGSIHLEIYGSRRNGFIHHGWHEERHCNGDFELHIVLDGECFVDMQNTGLHLKASDALLITPGQYHCSSASGPFVRFTANFTIKSASPDHISALKSLPYRTFQVDGRTASLCRQIDAELSGSEQMRDDLVKSLFVQLFILIFRSIGWPGKSGPSAFAPPVDWRTGVIDNFFEHNFTSCGTKEILARQLNLSERQLDRVLQKHYGMNFRDKLMQARIDYAVWLLRTTDYKISRIQNMAGYASATAFFKAFKSACGITPKKYRDRCKKETVHLRSSSIP